jgi:hypothetical protein
MLGSPPAPQPFAARRVEREATVKSVVQRVLRCGRRQNIQRAGMRRLKTAEPKGLDDVLRDRSTDVMVWMVAVEFWVEAPMRVMLEGMIEQDEKAAGISGVQVRAMAPL